MGTVGAGDVIYIPAGFYFGERVSEGKDSCGFRCAVLCCGDTHAVPELEYLTSDVLPTGAHNPLVDESIKLLSATIVDAKDLLEQEGSEEVVVAEDATAELAPMEDPTVVRGIDESFAQDQAFLEPPRPDEEAGTPSALAAYLS